MNNVTTKGPFIDGFAINCCEKKRVITIKDSIYEIGCFEGTYDEAVKIISEKYTGKARDLYISKLNDARDMSWLTDVLHGELVTHEDWHVRVAVAEYSDKYHEQLKDDDYWCVRVAVARYSDKYHEQLKDDNDYEVRLAVANYKKKEK